MRGSVIRVSRKNGSGCILAEDGNEVYFERSSVDSNAVDEGDLKAGHYVEFQLQYGFERPCAVNVKRLDRDSG
jgi:cold shock CspA family protein